MEHTTGDEYQLPVGSTSLSDFIKTAPDVGRVYLYNQNEFASELGCNLCTIYWPMTALSALIGRQLTKDERYQLATIRYSAPDFSPSSGGQVIVWVDIMRKWWNEHNPDNPIVSFQVANHLPMRRAVYDRRLIYVSGYSGNHAYNEDARDGWLAGNSFGNPTYWHCTAEILATVLDNYDNKYDRADYFGCVRNGVTHRFGYVLFLEKSITTSGQLRTNAIKIGIWNGSDPDRIATRLECATMIARKLYGKDATADMFTGWNKERPNDSISPSELQAMFERAGLVVPKSAKRGDIAEILWS